MIEPPRGEKQHGSKIIEFEVRHFLHDLLRSESGCKQVKYVRDADAHSSDAWPATALLGIRRDSIETFHHAKV